MPESNVTFSLVLHAHQPTGNFDFVFRETFDQCYRPLLEEIARHPAIPVSLHYSGILLEWLDEHESGYLDQLGEMVESGQIELLGGGFGEPVLVMLNDRDRSRQIAEMSGFLERRFGKRPRGLWLTERVWEQSLVRDIAAAGIEYTQTDDSIFRSAGFRGDDLYHSYIAEDRGETIRIFPISERLRYLIPFEEPHKTVEFLESVGDLNGDRVLVYGDDAEKFGGWPGTHKRVFENGWLAAFLKALGEKRKTIHVRHAADALAIPPRGKAYLPDASYREMTEWALPMEAQREFENLKADLGDLSERAAPFLRGGFWRTFLAKYPESGDMYGHMMETSNLVATLPAGSDARKNAERELFRAQCNCAYWHGVFGGLYLPHLRFAIYNKLLAAEKLANREIHGDQSWVNVRPVDQDRDGFLEVALSSDLLSLLVHPARGGHLIEVNDVVRDFSLTAAMSRRPEAYHRKIIEAANHGGGGDDDSVASIHDRVVLKEEGLEKLLIYDTYRRESLIDHFHAPGTTLDDVASGGGDKEIGDFVVGAYKAVTGGEEEERTVTLSRSGTVRSDGAAIPVALTKEIRLRAGEPGFSIGYNIRNEGDRPLRALFSIEFLLALLAGDAHDRRLFDQREDLGPLNSRHDIAVTTLIGARDEYLELSAGYSFSREAGCWIFPIQTVSLSEGGFESVFQATVFQPHWELDLPPGEEWIVELNGFVLAAGEEETVR